MIICIRMVKQMKISNIKKISGRVLSYIVSRESIITLITCVAVSIIIGACMVYSRKDEDKSIKVGRHLQILRKSMAIRLKLCICIMLLREQKENILKDL